MWLPYRSPSVLNSQMTHSRIPTSVCLTSDPEPVEVASIRSVLSPVWSRGPSVLRCFWSQDALLPAFFSHGVLSAVCKLKWCCCCILHTLSCSVQARVLLPYAVRALQFWRANLIIDWSTSAALPEKDICCQAVEVSNSAEVETCWNMKKAEIQKNLSEVWLLGN